jgi:hypothetical protein
MELKSLTQRIECVELESWSLRMLSEFLGDSSMRLGVPFIAPRQLGAVGGQLGRPNFPSVGCRTTTVHVRCSISFHTKSSRPLVLRIGWRTGHYSVHTGHYSVHTEHYPVHTGQSGVPNRSLARPHVARRLRGRPLALAAVGSPNSPVHHRTVR